MCLFLTGFSWPMTAIPPFWQKVALLFPSTFGCRAFINLNTAGGTLETIAPEIRAMTLQTVIYYFLSFLAVFAENKVIEHRDALRRVRDRLDERRGIDREEDRRIIAG